MDEIARIVKQFNLSIKVCGAVDSFTGTSEINRSLGASRSEYIYSQLLHRGIDKKRISEANKGGIDAYTRHIQKYSENMLLHYFMCLISICLWWMQTGTIQT